MTLGRPSVLLPTLTSTVSLPTLPLTLRLPTRRHDTEFVTRAYGPFGVGPPS